MLRNRSKQALMADQIPSPTPLSSLISPRFFNGLLTKSHQDLDTTTTSISPKSILDTKNSSKSINHFGYERNSSPNANPTKPQNPQTISSCSNNVVQEAIGLALIDSFNQENTNANSLKPINRMALFGSSLKVQIPAVEAASTAMETPKSPADFGIKTRNSLVLGVSVSPETPAREFSRQLSLKEMEMSEDYTCVITHGPNPKTIHIFDDCIVESSCVDDVGSDGFESPNVSTSSSDSFLRFCHSCKDSLCKHEGQSEERDFDGTKHLERDDAL